MLVLRVFPALAAVLLALPIRLGVAAESDPPQLTDYSSGSRHFTVAKSGGRWRLMDPKGEPFFLAALMSATGADPADRPDFPEWIGRTKNLLRECGFNALGAQNDPYAQHMFHIPYLAFAAPSTRVLARTVPAGTRPPIPGVRFADPFLDAQLPAPLDVWDDGWRRNLAQEYWRAMLYAKDDPNCVGLMPDCPTEAPRFDRWEGRLEFLALFLRDSSTHPAATSETLRFLQERYKGRIAALNSSWKTDFTDWQALINAAEAGPKGFDAELVVEATPAQRRRFSRPTPENLPKGYLTDSLEFSRRYFGEYFSAIEQHAREAAPRQLLLSPPIDAHAEDWVFELAARHCDIVSVTLYSTDTAPLLSRLTKMVKKPMLLTDFAVRGLDAETGPAVESEIAIYDDQQQRAQAAESLLAAMGEAPGFVGYQWLGLFDAVGPGGRVANIGVLSRVGEQRYHALIEALGRANGRLQLSRR